MPLRELEFPEVFFDESKRKDSGGFDAVVGNPPYIRIQEMVGVDSGQLKFFSETYKAAKQNYDIYSLFAEKGFKLIKGKVPMSGQVGLILPNKFFTVDYGRGLRQFLADNRAIACIIDFDAGQVFSEVTTYTCLLFLSGAITETFPYYRLPLGQPIEPSLQLAVRDATVILSTSLLGEESWLFSQLDEHEIIVKLDKLGDRLDRVTERIFQGIKTGADKIYIVEFIHRTSSKLEILSKQLEASRNVEADLWHPLIKGGDSDRFDMRSTNLAVLFPYSTTPNGKVRLITENQMKKVYPKTYGYLLENRTYLENREDGKMRGSNWYAYTRNQALEVMPLPKLFTPDFAPSASFSYDIVGEIFFTGGAAGGYGILVKQGWNQLYVLTLLNSKVLDWRLSRNTTTFRGGWRSYESRFISELPIRRINFTLSSEQRTYYLEKARNLYAYCLDKRDQDCVLGFVDHHLARVPEESDVVHDLLAMLAEEMIRLNKEKRAAQRDFLDWLVATLKITPDKEGRQGIDALTGKSKLLDYPGDYQKGATPLATGELLEILQKNKGRLGVSLSDTALADRLRKVYEESLERVLPLKERLERTDRLIDAVVYRLYGLTEEEIGGGGGTGVNRIPSRMLCNGERKAECLLIEGVLVGKHSCSENLVFGAVWLSQY